MLCILSVHIWIKIIEYISLGQLYMNCRKRGPDFILGQLNPNLIWPRSRFMILNYLLRQIQQISLICHLTGITN